MINDGFNIKGRLQIELNGEVVRDIDNLVVTTGKSYIASRIVGTASTIMSHMAIGIGSTTPVAGDSTLGSESGRVTLASSSSSGGTVTYTATFPAGTLSGAPKVRAMEIIDEVEILKRNIYSGAIGNLSWHGGMDLAIAIRTAVIKDEVLYVQAGAGIVYDSIPEMEWQETMDKAQALIKAAQNI
mgnify:CR=1 FL=1